MRNQHKQILEGSKETAKRVDFMADSVAFVHSLENDLPNASDSTVDQEREKILCPALR